VQEHLDRAVLPLRPATTHGVDRVAQDAEPVDPGLLDQRAGDLVGQARGDVPTTAPAWRNL